MIINYKSFIPKIAASVFISPGCFVIGEVELAEDVSLWFGAVLRGDDGRITIGKGSNVQDNSVLHEGANIGEYVTIGHSAILHKCTVKNNALIGSGAVVWDEVVVGENSIVGVGAVVPQNMIIPPNSLVLGVPAKVRRELKDYEIQTNTMAAHYYIELAKEYQRCLEKQNINQGAVPK